MVWATIFKLGGVIYLRCLYIGIFAVIADIQRNGLIKRIFRRYRRNMLSNRGSEEDVMKNNMLQNIKKFLRLFMIVEAGSFVGRALQIYTRYRKQPGYYALTEPWYMDVLHWGFVTGIIIAITAVAYWFVCRKIKKTEPEE